MPLLAFDNGTLTLNAAQELLPPDAAALLRPDPRTQTLRGRGCDYAEIVMALRRGGCVFTDAARDYTPLNDLALAEKITPRPHQSQALELWKNANFRGIAALPTGAGKTILAVLAIAELRRPALILAPTIDLVVQWVSVLSRFFRREIGMLGGGSHEVKEITVSTYDSAVLQMEFIGNRFALLVADECHHLPAPEYAQAAAMCIAPFRLGLSATPEADEERSAVMEDLLGPVVCRVDIGELEGNVLSRYRVERIFIHLEPEELAAYQQARSVYTAFLRRERINFSHPDAWSRFLGLCAREPGGREAFRAFLEQRRIARGGTAKINKLWELLSLHAEETVIVFTADNDTAYSIGRRFALPVLTHHTKAAERKAMLDAFRSGTIRVLVTSKVLNEGVDVPGAAVGIVLSGSGSVREHVQRLGRILRPSPGKEQAVLYELVSGDTGEEFTSERRRAHSAYRHGRGTPSC